MIRTRPRIRHSRTFPGWACVPPETLLSTRDGGRPAWCRGRLVAAATAAVLLAPAPGRRGVRRRYPGAVRLTVFWQKMRAQFGDAYAASVAKDYVLADLGGRTVDQALADGVEPKVIWRAVSEAFEMPEESR
jgi:hypothetical protein